MKRTLAVIAVGVGLTLTGVALGLLYLDVREFRAAVKAAELAGGDSDDAGMLPLVDNPARAVAALVCGSLGAGLTGAGALLAFFELPFMRRRDAIQYNPVDPLTQA